jgi:hypothetical protein
MALILISGSRGISNLFENSWRFSLVKVHSKYQRHQWKICRPESTTPVENLPLASTTPVANFATGTTKFAAGVNDSGGK